MSKYHRVLFVVHSVVAFLAGLPLLLAPGRTLGLFGWAPIDPLISRLLGAALLALAWSSYAGFRARSWTEVKDLFVMEIIFTSLGALGLLRHLTKGSWPYYVWTIFIVLVLFALAWVLAYFTTRPKAQP